MNRVALLSLALVLSASRIAVGDPITLVSDNRRVTDLSGTLTPQAVFAPFDAQLPRAGQTSVVGTTTMAGSLFSMPMDPDVFCDDPFDPTSCSEVYWGIESQFSVDFEANLAAPFLLSGFIDSNNWALSITNRTTNTVVLPNPGQGDSVRSGVLEPGNRYRLYVYAGYCCYEGGLNQAEFSLQIFDPDVAAAFGGSPSASSLLGGSATGGGLDITLGPSTGQGVLSATFDTPTQAELEALYGSIPFALPNGSSSSLWDISGGELFDGLAEITFAYDPSQLPPGFDETRLAIFHLGGGGWEELLSTVDPSSKTITAFTDSFSPFVVGITLVPEPGTALLLGGGLIGLARCGRGRSRTMRAATVPARSDP